MINFDEYVNQNKTEHNQKWPYIPDHPHKMQVQDLENKCIIEVNNQSTRY